MARQEIILLSLIPVMILYDEIVLASDTSGYLELTDGSQLHFTGIERIEW